VTWKPIIEEVQFSVLDNSPNGDEEPRLSSFVRCNLMKICDNLLGPSEQADVCLKSLQNHTAELRQASEKFESLAFKRPENMPLGDGLAISEIASNLAQPPSSKESHIEEMQDSVSIGGLSEEEKHAGMKRRYSMLQQNLKMPVEEERRLKRERLRNLVPVWSKKRTDTQLLDGCKN
jgi:hypothetical protein